MALDRDATRGLSKGMANLLRHKNPTAPATDGAGWAAMDDLVSALAARSRRIDATVDAAAVAETVASPEGEGRFEISPDGTRVRALSGHSFPVGLGHEPYVPTGPLWFGTVVDRAARIEEEGLLGSKKLKARLLDSPEAAHEVAVRRGCMGPAVYEVDAPALAAAGHAFERAPNGEILTDKFGPGFMTPVAPSPKP